MTFSHLPPEIRLQIYYLALPTQHPYIIGRDYGHRSSNLEYPSLLHLSRRLRQESLSLFFGSNTFIIDIHELNDLKHFLKWIDVTNDEVLASIKDLRLTVSGALLVDLVPKSGRRRYGDGRVIASKPRLDNSLRWDRKNILHYVHDFFEIQSQIEALLEGVEDRGAGDSRLRVQHLVRLVETVFKVDKLDDSGKKMVKRLAC